MKEEIKELNDDELIYVLKNVKTKVEKEDIIWKIAKERIETKALSEDQKDNKMNKSTLMGTVNINFLNREDFKE